MTTHWGVWYERRDETALLTAGWIENSKGDPKIFDSLVDARQCWTHCMSVMLKGERFEVREYVLS